MSITSDCIRNKILRIASFIRRHQYHHSAPRLIQHRRCIIQLRGSFGSADDTFIHCALRMIHPYIYTSYMRFAHHTPPAIYPSLRDKSFIKYLLFPFFSSWNPSTVSNRKAHPSPTNRCISAISLASCSAFHLSATG